MQRLVRDLEPDVVGLSVMTFQRTTALRLASFIRALRPSVRIVAGGYDPSLAPHAYEASPAIDFVVRGEGEHTLRELLRALESDPAKRSAADRSASERSASDCANASARLRMPCRSSPTDQVERGGWVTGSVIVDLLL